MSKNDEASLIRAMLENMPISTKYLRDTSRSPLGHYHVGGKLGAFPGDAGPEKPREGMVADQFYEDTFAFPKLFGKNNDKKWTNALSHEVIKYRPILKRAIRYLIDDDLLRTAARLAITATPEKMLSRLTLCRMPYDTLALQFNPKVFAEVLNEMGADVHGDVPDRPMMFLVRRDEKEETDCVVELISHFDQKDVRHLNMWVPMPFAMIFSSRELENPLERRVADHLPFRATAQQKEDDTTTPDDLVRGLSTVGWGYTDSWRDMLDGKTAAPQELANHMRVGVNKIHWAGFQYLMTQKGKEDEQVMQIIMNLAQSLWDTAGYMRLFATLVAMINEVPTTTHFFEPKGHIKTSGHCRQEFMSYNTLYLKLPSTRTVSQDIWAAKYLMAGITRKRGMVEGHWRCFKKKELFCQPLEHNWFESGNRAICLNCEAEATWIAEFARGDASKGWVDHGYVVGVNKKGGKRNKYKLPPKPPKDDPNARRAETTESSPTGREGELREGSRGREDADGEGSDQGSAGPGAVEASRPPHEPHHQVL